MLDLSPITEAVESVFDYLDGAAQVGDEGARWIAYLAEGRPTTEVGVYRGAAGISFFLSDYFRHTGSLEARRLAKSALSWSTLSEHGTTLVDLGAGSAGIGLAWLRYFEATGDEAALEQASELAADILRRPPGVAYEHDLTGDVWATDLFRGLAGQGLFLLRLWDHTRENAVIEFLLRGVDTLDRSATRDHLGAHWPIYLRTSGLAPPESGRFTGFCHGLAGIGYFLALLFERTGEDRCSRLMVEICDTLQRHETPAGSRITWKRWIEYPDIAPCQWCHGTVGIGLFFTRAYLVSSDVRYLAKAKQTADAAFAMGDFDNSPVQCHGLAGNGELLIELYRATGDRTWLDKALRFAEFATAYRKSTPAGDIWQNGEPGVDSPCFYCGAAGIGHFFLRLLSPDELRMPVS